MIGDNAQGLNLNTGETEEHGRLLQYQNEDIQGMQAGTTAVVSMTQESALDLAGLDGIADPSLFEAIREFGAFLAAFEAQSQTLFQGLNRLTGQLGTTLVSFAQNTEELDVRTASDMQHPGTETPM